ncbi:MAG: hypothetical protein WAK55_30220 [Xanthobacteraceae bacterium]
MRATILPPILTCLLLTGLSLTPAQSAQPAQPVPWHPCAQIAAACREAGFIPNGASMGVGIMLDCIRPIVIGTAQRMQATKPLPQIDPQVVMACEEQSPNFGTGGATSRPSAQPATTQSGT